MNLYPNDKSSESKDNPSSATVASTSPSVKLDQRDNHDTVASHPDLKSSDRKPTTTTQNPVDTGKNGEETRHFSTKNPEEIRKTVAGGLEALGKIADMLRSPESTAALVDAIVKEDTETGPTSLTIPVPDKSTVVRMLR